MYYAYVLINRKGNKTYVGITLNITKRLKEHNEGCVKSSKHFRPYIILKLDKFITKNEARERELFYKSPTGRRRLKKIVEDWKIRNS